MGAKPSFSTINVSALGVLLVGALLSLSCNSAGSGKITSVVAASSSSSGDPSSENKNEQKQVFIEGITRNLALPAPFNSFLIEITATAQLGGTTGFASDREDTVPGVACSFNITSAQKAGDVVTLEGSAFKAVNPANAPTMPGGNDGLGLEIIADHIEGDLASVTVTFIRPDSRPAFFTSGMTEVRRISFQGFGILRD